MRKLLIMLIVVLAPSASAMGESLGDSTGTWTGIASQNEGKSGYTVVMTISATGAETDYPDLKCSGKLTPVGAKDGYVFFIETITRGSQASGGNCIDGTITIALAADKLAWGWVGVFRGETYVAWSTLTKK